MGNEPRRLAVLEILYRLGWFLRPVGFATALVAGMVALLTIVYDLPRGVLIGVVASIGAGLFVLAVAADRRWRTASSAAAIDAERRWQSALGASTQSSADGMAQVPPRGSQLVQQARGLSRADLKRLSAEPGFGFAGFRVGAFVGRRGADIALQMVERENSHRADLARKNAIAAARSAIERHGATAQYLVLLGQAQEAVRASIGSSDDPKTPEAEDALAPVEWAALALVAEAWITDRQFAVLYGPWWRAVVRNTRPVWSAGWNALSLAGFWLSIVGCVLAALLNEGQVGYFSLAVIVSGVAALAAGATWGASSSVVGPEPARTGGASRQPAAPGIVHRVWRSPERLVPTLRGISFRWPHLR